MKVCFFGSYEQAKYNVLLKKILELQKIEVIECHEKADNIFSLFKVYLKLSFKHRKLNYDVMIIPWRGIMTLPLAKLISKKPIVFFAYISIYDTLVNDRKKIKPKSLKAKIIHLIEKLACRWSDLIILDSYGEINYFINEYGINKEKFRRLFLSADESKFKPTPFNENQKPFMVLYFGEFIPVHGVDVIIEAAKILSDNEDIIFNLCGDGQTKKKMEELVEKHQLKNINFLGYVDDDILIENIFKSNVCLGLLGKTPKAMRCISNKTFQILSSARPLIALDSSGIKEIDVKNDKNSLLIHQNNPQELADAILFLKNNPKKCKEISFAGHELFIEKLSMDVTGKKLASYLKELVKKIN